MVDFGLIFHSPVRHSPTIYKCNHMETKTCLTLIKAIQKTFPSIIIIMWGQFRAGGEGSGRSRQKSFICVYTDININKYSQIRTPFPLIIFIPIFFASIAKRNEVCRSVWDLQRSLQDHLLSEEDLLPNHYSLHPPTIPHFPGTNSSIPLSLCKNHLRSKQFG